MFVYVLNYMSVASGVLFFASLSVIVVILLKLKRSCQLQRRMMCQTRLKGVLCDVCLRLFQREGEAMQLKDKKPVF